MMLSRTGWGETSLPVAFQTVGGRRAPWGCAAGAPYRGTASPPPPPVCVCVCVWFCLCSDVTEKYCTGICWDRLSWIRLNPSFGDNTHSACVPTLRCSILHPPRACLSTGAESMVWQRQNSK